ncbi:hypothetical protein [Candidatus Odyssella acanthamoebae]|uniref:hypothetical protein n=1 Tax=Candidatus Odyssella acanthamoebae TaxID=91604 RepID=UPI001E3A1112|nr:hypothetical protein [Candidatus Paracaedibacter acanthamoebae]
MYSGGLILFPTKQTDEIFFTGRKNFSLLILEEHENYHYIIFEILKKLLPQINLEPIISEFRQFHNSPQDQKTILSSHSPLPPLRPERREKTLKAFLGPLKKKKTWAVGAAFFILSIVGLVVSISSPFNNEPFLHNGKILLTQSICSDLPLPHTGMLLQRPELINEIKEVFKSPEEIGTVALVGIGGAGKTTLARQYALTQRLPVIWEINAETKESLIHAFENLAYDLSKTEEERY